MFTHPEPKFWLRPWCQSTFASPLETNPGCAPDDAYRSIKRKFYLGRSQGYQEFLGRALILRNLLENHRVPELGRSQARSVHKGPGPRAFPLSPRWGKLGKHRHLQFLLMHLHLILMLENGNTTIKSELSFKRLNLIENSLNIL